MSAETEQRLAVWLEEHDTWSVYYVLAVDDYRTEDDNGHVVRHKGLIRLVRALEELYPADK